MFNIVILGETEIYVKKVSPVCKRKSLAKTNTNQREKANNLRGSWRDSGRDQMKGIYHFKSAVKTTTEARSRSRGFLLRFPVVGRSAIRVTAH